MKSIVVIFFLGMIRGSGLWYLKSYKKLYLIIWVATLHRDAVLYDIDSKTLSGYRNSRVYFRHNDAHRGNGHGCGENIEH